MSNTLNDCSVGSMSAYRGAPDTDCSGPLHRITIQWKVRGGNPAEGEKPLATKVCEAHVAYFAEMGAREGNLFDILSDETLEPTVDKEQEQ